ncbi:MAG: transposase [Lentisphaerae bacterium]|nr:transposase [Lentisphaerota bacterium]
MRAARIKELGPAYYHVISRVVDRRMIFDADEKERFRILMRACEAFSALRILTWSVLDNHFHIVLHVPSREMVSDETLLHRLAALYNRRTVQSIERRLKEKRNAGDVQEAERIKSGYTYRMYDLSEFAKTLKQRLTQGYNRRHGRKGTLWEERFKSLVVEGEDEPLLSLAAYVDLNAVRAGIVADPKDYRFCGYGEAVAGNSKAREGLAMAVRTLVPTPNWEQVSAIYRQFLYIRGAQRGMDESGNPLHLGFSAQNVAAILDQGGTLGIAELLHCRVRYFIDGAILGSRSFVNEAFKRHRQFFGRKRQSGARPMKGGKAWGDLCTARRLRLSPIIVSSPR